MSSYSDIRTGRMKRNRRRARRIRAIVLLVVCVVIVVIALIVIISSNSKIRKKVTLEAGKQIEINDFLKKDGIDAKFETDISKIDTSKPGDYDIEISVGNKTYDTQLIIEDTIAPKCDTVDVTANINGDVSAEQFVTNIDDETNVSIDFKEAPDMSKEGEQNVTVILKDEGDNTTTVEAKLVVVSDSEPPVISGAEDIEAYVGDTISYKKDIAVTDNMDENPTLDVDNSQVDLSKAGKYEVVYTATDSAGNTSSEKVTLTLKEKPKGYVEPDEVYALAQKVVDQITNDSMTDMEKAFAIYRWTKTNIGYTGTSNKDSWTIGAYQAFTKKSGDCFNYYAAAKAMLDVCGIDNVDIVKSDTSHSAHYWSLINLGDGWYHFDATPRKGGGNFFMLTDEELAAYSTTHKNSHIFDSSLYPERATKSVQSKVNYAKGTITE